MKQLTTAALALVVALLLMMSFNASAVAQRKVRPKATRIDYAQFSHRTHVESRKLACESCHKFPTANWNEVRQGDAAFADVAEFPEHGTCLGCHRQQFFARQRPAPAICSNCHVKVSPRDTARFMFPSLGDLTNHSGPKRNVVVEFAVEFPHDKHEDQECVACHQLDKEGDVKTKPNNHGACFSCHNVESELAPAPSACAACHKRTDPVAIAPGTDPIQVRLSTRNAVASRLVALGRGQQAAAPGSVTLGRRQQAAPGSVTLGRRQQAAPGSVTLGRRQQAAPGSFALGRRQQAAPALVVLGRRQQAAPGSFALGRRQQAAPGSLVLGPGQNHHAVAGGFVAVLDQRMRVPDNGDYSKFQHTSEYHQRLPCLLCHRRETNATRPNMPGGKDHLPCAGCHVKQFADRSSAICTNCHLDPSSGSLKTFPALTSFSMKFDHSRHTGVNCTNCHRPARSGVALTIPAGLNAHATCFQCHGPQAKSGDRDISSCGVCHQLGRPVRTTQTARAFKLGFSHAQHNRDERLSCNDCHRLRANDVTAPQALNHHAAAGAFSCMSCHNGKRAFGGDDFTVCTRCHTGSAWHF